eukprot:4632316-Pleurochrysis_carterae.AAC.1
MLSTYNKCTATDCDPEAIINQRWVQAAERSGQWAGADVSHFECHGSFDSTFVGFVNMVANKVNALRAPSDAA